MLCGGIDVNWNPQDARVVDRAHARPCSYPLLDLLVPIEDWPRCSCPAGTTTLQRRRPDDGRAWWWCSVCNLPVRRAGME